MRALDLTDIQGNVLWGYHLAKTRILFYRVPEGDGGRAFVRALAPNVTTSERWPAGKPSGTLNLAFTHSGLAALGVPARTLLGFPPDFQQGMRARAALLSDGADNDPSRWERPWHAGDVHIMVSLASNSAADLDRLAARVKASAAGVDLCFTEDGGRLEVNGAVTDKEHFGYTDGYSNPEIDGTNMPGETPGGGKLLPGGSWAPLETGELLLGYPDEAGALPDAPLPPEFVQNGTYLVYRKLHQRVASFRKFLREEGARYPGGEDLLSAKLMGRWRDGTPIVAGERARPPVDSGEVIENPAHTDYRYDADPNGFVCPMGAHTRRANPRDSTGFDTLLSQRRRIMRRGVTYGPWTPLDQPGDDDGEHGLHFIALVASLERQFEFVQREWLNYGNDFYQGNDGCPVTGRAGTRSRFLVQGDPRAGAARAAPHFLRDLPSFVRLLGGDYFFVPSIGAIDMIGEALVEAT